ncbi:MAG: hypothetical protein E7172_03880 [Firmicutes bacterium]|nr:hypothetical protein [Bacillota bacterium]
MKRKKIIISILSLMFLLSVGNVKAATLYKDQDFKKAGNTSVGNYLTYGGATNRLYVPLEMYSFNAVKEPELQGVTGYCIDPSLVAVNNPSVSTVFFSEDNSKGDGAWHAALYEILKHGYRNPTGGGEGNYYYNFSCPDGECTIGGAGGAGEPLFMATSLAIRTITMSLSTVSMNDAMSRVQGGSENTPYLVSSYINAGIEWASETAESRKAAADAFGVCTVEYKTKEGFQDCMKDYFAWKSSKYKRDAYMAGDGDSQSYSMHIYNGARDLFLKGLFAAQDYQIKLETNTAVAGEATIAEGTSKKISDEATGDFLQEEKYFNLTIKNIPETGFVKIDGFTCEDCADKGLSYTNLQFNNGSNWQDINPDLNLVPFANSEGIVELKIVFTKNPDVECDYASYEINYRYYDSSKDFYAGILEEDGIYGDTSYQRYVIMVPNDAENGTPGKFEGIVECFMEVCETKISTPVCAIGDAGITTITAPQNITTCIIDRIDDAKNTYQLSSDNNGIENEYCEVFCKEDYAEIRLSPVVEDIECGGYFKLEAFIDGSKDCYTAGVYEDGENIAIDEEEFIKDIIEAQKLMLDSYDRYIHYDTALKNIKGEPISCGSSCAGDCDDGHADGKGTIYTTTPEGGLETFEGVEITNIDETTGFVNFKIVAKDIDEYVSSDKSPCEGEEREIYNEEGESRTVCYGKKNCTGCCSYGNETDVRRQVEPLKDQAEADLKEAYELYQSILHDYNSCTTGWDNVFKLNEENPKLRFDYDQEEYMGLLSDEDKYLVADSESFETEVEVEICMGDIDEFYGCLNDSKFVTENDSSADEWGYKDNYGSGFSDNTYTECTTSGCERKVRPTSQARYVRKSVNSKQDYTTPTIFSNAYPEGKINVVGYGKMLENALPISPDTVGGGNFWLRLEDFGEFYDTGELGRLIDFEGENEDKSVANALKEAEVETFDGEYLCNYITPCRPNEEDEPECPNCEYECWDDPGTDWDDCEWNPCGTACDYECINCLFDQGDLDVTIKTISTTKFNSANRTMGYNWLIRDDFSKLSLELREKLSLIADKSDLTISEIENLNEQVYNKDGSDSEFAFSIELNGNTIRRIKEYNEEVEKYGGYANPSLVCYDYTASDGKVYNQIFCYSTFIDELVEEGYNIETGVERLIDEDDRRSNANATNYWTPYAGYVYNESVIGGPAWK